MFVGAANQTFIFSSTFTNNTAGNGTYGTGGAIHIQAAAGFSLTNSIVSGNNAVTAGSDFRDVTGTHTATVSFSLIGNTNGNGVTTANGNLINVAAGLGVLQNNGGATPTHALLPGSPAINQGNPAFVPPPATDQRGAGFNRVINGRVDMGAYEFQPPSTTTILVSSLNPVRKGQSVTFTATVAVGPAGSNSPPGTVTFLDGGTPLATVALVNGVALFTTSSLSGGRHQITANYSGFTRGDYTFNASSASLTQTVIGSTATAGIYAVGVDAGAAPEVKVYDAVTGAQRFSFLPYDQTFHGGVHVAIGDVNGDGVADIITGPGAGGGPLVEVFSGKDLSLLAAFNAYDARFLNGVFVASGDVNGDGFADIITAPDAGGGPLVEVFSGKDLSLLMAFNAYDPAFRGGVHVAAGDVDGDGFEDIITGPGVGGGPLVNVYSGTNGGELLSFNAYAIGGNFLGGVFATAGDLDGDGKAEIITGPGLDGGPLVRVFQGTTGVLQASFNAYDPNNSNGQLMDILSNTRWRSGLRVATTDVNGDGRAEIITGPGPGQPSEIKIFDAASLTVIDDFFALNPILATGVFVGGR
jgi:hypothetical protein